jgi:hypothetical protein
MKRRKISNAMIVESAQKPSRTRSPLARYRYRGRVDAITASGPMSPPPHHRPDLTIVDITHEPGSTTDQPARV